MLCRGGGEEHEAGDVTMGPIGHGRANPARTCSSSTTRARPSSSSAAAAGPLSGGEWLPLRPIVTDVCGAPVVAAAA